MKREDGASNPHSEASRPQVPWLEWVASSIGLLLVLGIFGVIGWQVFNGATTPPVITVEVETVAPVEGGYRVLFRARNTAGEAAAQVGIKGRLSAAGTDAETSRVVLDYIPGRSERHGGLFFVRDPAPWRYAPQGSPSRERSAWIRPRPLANLRRKPSRLQREDGQALRREPHSSLEPWPL